MIKTIREIVGENRELLSVSLDQPIRQVIDYMFDKKAGAVAICDGDQVVGVFSERDLLRRVVHKFLDIETTSVRVVMTSPVYWISMDERYEVAKAIMVDKGLRHLVVMDETRNFCGFVSARELLEADLSDSRELVGKLNDDYYEHQFKPKVIEAVLDAKR
jgi:CBS domain-containing protein